MGMWIGRNRKARVTYGFDEIALVPGSVTLNPNEVNTTFRLPRRDMAPLELKIPILASAMDGVVDVRFAIEMSRLGGLAVLNLEGVQTRYKNPSEVLEKFCREMRIPVIVGNTVGYDVTLEIMGCGPAAVLVGVGPGAACTSRGVLGLGVPQVTATVDCAAARDAYFKKTARFVPIITDGGMSRGGDVCKALACGADAVMVGSAFAKAYEAPGRGYHWGMATPHANLPRGTRIKVGATGSLKQILFGPAEVDDGSQNLVGAITTCMGNVGARDLADFQQTEIIIAPSIKTEGKLFQTVQNVGMGTR